MHPTCPRLLLTGQGGTRLNRGATAGNVVTRIPKNKYPVRIGTAGSPQRALGTGRNSTIDGLIGDQTRPDWGGGCNAMGRRCRRSADINLVPMYPTGTCLFRASQGGTGLNRGTGAGNSVARVPQDEYPIWIGTAGTPYCSFGSCRNTAINRLIGDNPSANRSRGGNAGKTARLHIAGIRVWCGYAGKHASGYPSTFSMIQWYIC